MISFKYTKPIRNKILNYHYTVTKINFNEIDNIKCNCQKYKNTKYYNQHQHVITGDFTFVKNKKLQILLERGPQYRDDPSINWNEAKEEIINGIKNYINHREFKY